MLMSGQLFDEKSSFLYECDEVPFDEIPPEPGREIQNQGHGEIRIRVNKDATDNHIDDHYDSRQSPPIIKMDGTLKRTINHSNECERSVRRPSYYDDRADDRAHSSRDYEMNDRYNRYDYEPEPRYRNSQSDYDSEIRPNERVIRRASPNRDRDFNTQHFRTSPRKAENHYDYNDHKLDIRVPRSPPPTRYDRRYSNECFDDRHHSKQSPNDNFNNRSGRQASGNNYDSRDDRITILKVVNNNSRLPNDRIRDPPISPPIQRALSDRLGPPVRKDNVSAPLRKPLINHPNQNQPKSRSTTNFIEKNIAASMLSKNKRLGPRPVKQTVIKQPTLIKRQNEIKKVKTNNPFSKAKQRTVPQKSNLSKNIALKLKKSLPNPSVSTECIPTNSNTGNVIANLIQGILEEPDVKQMISTIAQQSVSTTADAPNNNAAADKAASSLEHCQDQKTLQEVANKILNKANSVINDNCAQLEGSQFQANRPIPPVKTKQVRIALYCKSCKLEFPSTILRDLHYKTEMHCFVNGDWWKFNPKPPKHILRNKYPLSVFCIPCWDLVRLQSDKVFSLHMESKRHKANKSKFREVFGHVPMYPWCMWEDLSINFRNNFVPIPGQLRNVMHPEYVYDERVIRK